jgi:glycosyltransferase involved in cell wall biosynthesis
MVEASVTGEASRTVGVSLFIPARNVASTLAHCLDAVGRLHDRPARVAVFNDASSDATPDIARACALDIELIDATERFGLGAIRNRALEWCSTSHLAFLNADCYPQPTWMTELRRTMTATGAAVVGGRQVEVRRRTLPERWKARHLRQDLGHMPLSSPDFLSGGNLLVDLRQTGEIGFDGRLQTAYEDVDFCRRVRAAGKSLAYDPAAIVEHDHPEGLTTLPRKVWSYGAFSRSVGPVHTVPDAPRAFVRMHRRPHDPLARAIVDDARCGRVGWLALDAYLLTASLVLFVRMACASRRHRWWPTSAMSEH